MLLNRGDTSAGAGAGAGDIIDTTTQTFMADVIEESRRRPVLVDFWAPWCGPCKTLGPVIEKAVAASKGKVRLAKMNIDEHPAIAGRLGVQSIPAVYAFVNGQPVDGFMGAVPESQVKTFIERLLRGAVDADMAEILAAGEQALVEGDAPGAAEIFAHVLQQEPDNLKAFGGLVRAQVLGGAPEQARATLDMVPAGKENDSAISAARAALELAEQAASLGEIAPLEAAVAADPSDHQARFDLALAYNARNQRDLALQHLLDIVKRDRAWNEDGARKQIVQFFEAWGPTDPHTVSGRRKLSTILFS